MIDAQLTINGPRGSSARARIVKAEIVVTDHDNKPAFDEAWATWMPANHGPVRSFVQSVMPEGDLIEIIITAAL